MNRWIKVFVTIYLLSNLLIGHVALDGASRGIFEVIIYPAVLSGVILLGFYLNERGGTQIIHVNRRVKGFVVAYFIIFATQFIIYGVPDGTFHEIFEVVIHPAILSGCITLGFYLNERGVTIRGIVGRGSNNAPEFEE